MSPLKERHPRFRVQHQNSHSLKGQLNTAQTAELFYKRKFDFFDMIIRMFAGYAASSSGASFAMTGEPCLARERR